jgi:hypothetical protein
MVPQSFCIISRDESRQSNPKPQEPVKHVSKGRNVYYYYYHYHYHYHYYYYYYYCCCCACTRRTCGCGSCGSCRFIHQQSWRGHASCSQAHG